MPLRRPQYHADILARGEHPKLLLGNINRPLNRPTAAAVTAEGRQSEVAESFGDFFAGKVARIYQGLEEYYTSSHPVLDIQPVELPPGCLRDLFRPATKAEVAKLLSKVPAKHCALDPMPTSIS